MTLVIKYVSRVSGPVAWNCHDKKHGYSCCVAMVTQTAALLHNATTS